MKLSVIIPSWKDPLLIKTIDSILENSGLGADLEIIAVLDGYWPTFDLREDKGVRYIHLGKNRGMRGAINAGVAASRGEYLMRTDEHCKFSDGFAKTVLKTIRPNWIVTMRRYFLDPIKWEVMDKRHVDFERLVIQEDKKFTGQPWRSRDKRYAKINIAPTMAMQGSCWIMSRKWWGEVIGELESDGYGTHYQDSHEMVFKTWQKGGHLMLNKYAWFAHRHRSFPRTHHYSRSKAEGEWKYSLDKWRDYYEKEVRVTWGI